MANKDKATDEIQMISLSELKPYEDAPFKVRDDENMKELVQSIKDSGILVPLIARPHAEGGFEILAGHRRAEASKQNNLEKVPVIVKDFDDDTAVILLVDSNLHREDILPSEKALAYQMKMEALSHQGKRNDLTSCQVGEKLSVEIISEGSNDSPRNVHRYLRLNNLVDNIRDMVDNKTIPFNTGVEMSYLTAKQQVELLNTIEAEDNTIPTIDQVRQMRKKADEGELTTAIMEQIMRTEKPERIKISFDGDRIKKYFPQNYSKKQIEDAVIKIIENWHRQQMKKRQMER